MKLETKTLIAGASLVGLLSGCAVSTPALQAQSDDRKIVVEGHTDSQGSDAINEPLSVNRAKAVRDYLISRGVKGDKISAVGLGSKRPLLDNRSAENRANNRRVEIVISPGQDKRVGTR